MSGGRGGRGGSFMQQPQERNGGSFIQYAEDPQNAFDEDDNTSVMTHLFQQIAGFA